jgi:hypothetical protein
MKKMKVDCDLAAATSQDMLGLFVKGHDLPAETDIRIRGRFLCPIFAEELKADLTDDQKLPYMYTICAHGIAGNLLYVSAYDKSICDAVNSPDGLLSDAQTVYTTTLFSYMTWVYNFITTFTDGTRQRRNHRDRCDVVSWSWG